MVQAFVILIELSPCELLVGIEAQAVIQPQVQTGGKLGNSISPLDLNPLIIYAVGSPSALGYP